MLRANFTFAFEDCTEEESRCGPVCVSLESVGERILKMPLYCILQLVSFKRSKILTKFLL